MTVAIIHAFSHVLLERAWNRKRHAAELASVDIFPHASVRAHVPCELARLSAGVVAHAAFVRLLPGVASPMNCQIAAVLEDLTTIFALVIAQTFAMRRAAVGFGTVGAGSWFRR